jgi:hypothetical protein
MFAEYAENELSGNRVYEGSEYLPVLFLLVFIVYLGNDVINVPQLSIKSAGGAKQSNRKFSFHPIAPATNS